MDDQLSRTVAILHDVVESGKMTVDDLSNQGFNDKICRAVDLLSRRKWESYDHYIKRVKTNKIAIKVVSSNRSNSSNKKVIRLKIVDEASSDTKKIVKGSDLIIIASPLSSYNQISPFNYFFCIRTSFIHYF
jgi:(p)ppGpp synthase/HD superfamily hydrolase